VTGFKRRIGNNQFLIKDLPWGLTIGRIQKKAENKNGDEAIHESKCRAYQKEKAASKLYDNPVNKTSILSKMI
jgi:hypothetical protein